MTRNEHSHWFDTSGVAAHYGVPEATVRKWRHMGTGPVGVKFGRHVRYSVAELERWEREQAVRQIRASA